MLGNCGPDIAAHVLPPSTGKAACVYTGFAYITRKMSGLLGKFGMHVKVVTGPSTGFCIIVITASRKFRSQPGYSPRQVCLNRSLAHPRSPGNLDQSLQFQFVQCRLR